MYDITEKPEMTGSLIFRDATHSVNLPQGKKLMMVFGVVAVDEDFQISGETMVRVLGQGGKQAINVALHPKGTPVDKKYAGWTINDMIEEPIWRA